MKIEKVSIGLMSAIAAIPVIVYAIFWIAGVSFKSDSALAQSNDNKKDIDTVRDDIGEIKGDIKEIKIMLRRGHGLRNPEQ